MHFVENTIFDKIGKSQLTKLKNLDVKKKPDELVQTYNYYIYLLILPILYSSHLSIIRQAFFHVKAQFHPKMIVLFSKCRKFILLLPSLIHIIKRWFVGVSCLSYTWRINNTLFSTSRKAIKNGASLFFFFFWLIKSRCFICFGFWKNSCLNLCFFLRDLPKCSQELERWN